MRSTAPVLENRMLGIFVGVLAFGMMLCSRTQAAQPSREVAEGGRAAELALSNDTLQLNYLTDGDNVGVDDGRLILGGFLSEQRDFVGSAALLVEIEPLLGSWLRIELGPKIYAALLEEENSDVFAFAIGTQLRWDVLRNRGVSLVGSAYYAPDIFSFGEADNLTDLAARLEMRLTNRVIGFAGARWFELDLLDQEERELQEELFVGARWQFE